MHTRIAGIRPMAALILLVIAAASIAGAQSESLSSVASELAGTIGGASLQGAIHDPGVSVNDFAQNHGARTALGVKLADQFSKALIATPKADFVVDGYIDVLPETIVLRVVTTRTSDKQTIFDKRTTLPLDAEMRSLLATPLPEPRAPSKNVPVSWVRPGYRVEDGAKAPHVDALKGYTAGQCIYCLRADYTDAAMVVKIQGTVTMDVLLDSEGRPAEIAIVDGLPCGLNRRAVDTIAKWKVTPAKDPSGKPTAGWTTITMTFQLY